jgi:hypothetical protein
VEKRRVVTIEFLAFLRGGANDTHLSTYTSLQGNEGKTSNKGLEQGVEGFSIHFPGMITGIICYNKSIFKYFC